MNLVEKTSDLAGFRNIQVSETSSEILLKLAALCGSILELVGVPLYNFVVDPALSSPGAKPHPVPLPPRQLYINYLIPTGT